MTEKEKKIIEKIKIVFPMMSESEKSYFLGYVEALSNKNMENKSDENEKIENSK